MSGRIGPLETIVGRSPNHRPMGQHGATRTVTVVLFAGLATGVIGSARELRRRMPSRC
ncbi:hypothetical protein [Rhizobium binxianense]